MGQGFYNNLPGVYPGWDKSTNPGIFTGKEGFGFCLGAAHQTGKGGKMKDIKKYTEQNRKAWNQAMPKHQAAAKEKLDRLFQTKGFVYPLAPELDEVFKRVGITGKDVVHLCCNNGVELLSIKNMGAGRCLGVDISDAAVLEARERAGKCGIDCEFMRADVFDIPSELYDSFDLVHITAGCLGWIPDVPQFFSIANRLLRKDGLFIIHEIHPFCEMLPLDWAEASDRLQLVEPYFRPAPIVDNCSMDYVGGTDYAAETQYWFVHPLSAIIMALCRNGFSLMHFSEHDRDISAEHKKQEGLGAKIPLSLILVAGKVRESS